MSEYLDQLRDLVRTHCATVQRDAQEIAVDMLALNPGSDAAMARSIRGKAHRLKSGSGMIGFDNVSRLSGQIEDILTGIEYRSAPPSPMDIAVVREMATRLRDAALALSPETSSICQ